MEKSETLLLIIRSTLLRTSFLLTIDYCFGVSQR